ncbi:DivIVA domain-containing protein [Plantactinospora sp. ZYX-F-223]|uniref:DivIVA domain-containing protein n=1 Tax=Plantactinospora sp. ZYX-F-223 TaxID=3144103 RepID=UPI0031FCB7B7
MSSVLGERRARPYQPMRPWQVRGRRFRTTWRGLDPGEVAAFLDRVADDLGGVYAQLSSSQEEAARIKDALRRWQSAQAPSMREMARR